VILAIKRPSAPKFYSVRFSGVGAGLDKITPGQCSANGGTLASQEREIKRQATSS